MGSDMGSTSNFSENDRYYQSKEILLLDYHTDHCLGYYYILRDL